MKDTIIDNFDQIEKCKTQYEGEYIVIKYGGDIAGNDESVKALARQIDFLKNKIGAKIVVVHGGKEQANKAFGKAGLNSNQWNSKTGRRITTAAMVPVFDTALRHLNNDNVFTMQVAAPDVTFAGGSGCSDQFKVVAKPIEKFTGRVVSVNEKLFSDPDNAHAVPVLYPVCENVGSMDGENRLNVNADEMAVAIAETLGAKRLFLLSNIDGVKGPDGYTMPEVSTDEIQTLIDNETVTDGMITKLNSAANATQQMPHGDVVILNGFKKDAIIREILCKEGNGTMITSSQKPDVSRQVNLGSGLINFCYSARE